MATIETRALTARGDVASMWADAAGQAAGWLAAQGLSPRDAVVLLPFAALLPPARAAFAAALPAGSWQPRIDTALTLADALGPPAPAVAGTFSGDGRLDRPAAAVRLARPVRFAPDPAAGSRVAADPDRAAELVVGATRALVEAAAAVVPSARGAWWARAEAAAGEAGASPEAALLREAVAWAREAPAPHTDRLFGLDPAAWIVLRIGGPDPVAEAVAAASADRGVPVLRLVADADAARPFAGAPEPADARHWRCADGEAEAQAAAWAVVEAVTAGRVPVALVALDRARTRRIRALLERAGVPLLDETGWRLSTTPAATRVIELLRAADPEAPPDARLAWLQQWPQADPRALRSLEARWRRRARTGSPADQAAAEHLERAAAEHLATLGTAARAGLERWVERLLGMLERDGLAAAMAADPAGRQVLQTLAVEAAPLPAAEFAGGEFDLPRFTRWVEQAFDDATFVPPADLDAPVVLTPLARAIGRPFATVIVPGADAENLGGRAPEPGLIGEALAARLGLPDRAQRRTRQRLALAQLLRAPTLRWIRREQEGGEPIGDSPDLAWLALERRRDGRPPWPVAPAPLPRRSIDAAPVPRPLPRAGALLPAALSATAIDALRECPYRFFARALLRLDEAQELDVALAKREYGNWLHDVLHRFHVARAAAAAAADGSGPADDEAGLHAAADAATTALDLDVDELLPFRASFEAFAPRYLRWLAAREAAGWRWLSGEEPREAAPPELAPTGLRGRIDRIDVGPGGRLQLLDYKTGSRDTIRKKLEDKLEDTQLPFYALLIDAPADVEAAYVLVDGRNAPLTLPHADVDATRRVLVRELGRELAAVRDGAPLPALGEAPVCNFCEARGLCRRDHWPADEAPSPR